MIYVFECEECGKQQEISCSMVYYDKLKAEVWCCGKLTKPVITGGVAIFTREPFPKGKAILEHAFEDEPPYCRDKVELKDLCEQQGTVSRYLEDDV